MNKELESLFAEVSRKFDELGPDYAVSKDDLLATLREMIEDKEVTLYRGEDGRLWVAPLDS